MDFLDSQGLGSDFSLAVERPRTIEDFMKSEGRFYCEHIRDGVVINRFDFPNGVTTIAKNAILDAAFNQGTQTHVFYMGLIDGSNGSPGGLTPTLSAADTMASHAGWTEFVDYNEAVRQTWPQIAASAGVVAGSATMVFTMGTLSTNIYVAGAFITTVNTKSGTTGICWATGLFSANAPAQTGDIFRLGYSTGLT